MDLKPDVHYWPSSSKGWMGSQLSWNEIGILHKLVETYKCEQFIDLEVGCGDTAIWMGLRCLHVPMFRYYGICQDDQKMKKWVIQPYEGRGNFVVDPGICHSEAIQRSIKSKLEYLKGASLIFCGFGDVERTFKTYMDIARPGDIMVAWGFPVTFHLNVFDAFCKNEQLKRIKEQTWAFDRLIAGVVL